MTQPNPKQAAGSKYSLQLPSLPDPDASRRTIDRAIAHEVTGRVAAVAGENIEIEGMTAPLGAICQVQQADGPMCTGRVIGFRDTRPILAPLDYLQTISAGDSVRLLDTSINLRVGPALCGRVIDAQGRPLDDRPLPKGLARVDAQQQPPESLDRPPIDETLQTGVRAIDAMLTCGQGQRLGIFAGSGVGKSTLMGMLARGSSADRIVIGMVGERGREVQEFIQRCLGEAGLKRSVVVVATSDKPAAQRVLAAWTATAIAESFRDQGDNVLLLLDSVTRFAMAQRELGLAAGEPPTTRGYPPSVFNTLPRLVERAGRTTKGSITAFYTVLVEGDDNNEPIADTLRGLLDGHIVLSRELATQAHWPPIDVLESLSRLQPHLVEQDVLAASAVVRNHLSQYRRSADLISIGAYREGSDPAIDAAISMREPLKLFLTQNSEDLTPIEQSHAAMVMLSRQSAAAVPSAAPTTAAAPSTVAVQSPAAAPAPATAPSPGTAQTPAATQAATAEQAPAAAPSQAGTPTAAAAP